MHRTLSLLALLSLPAFAQTAPAPQNTDSGAVTPPPSGTATTATTKGTGTKKEKPAPPAESKPADKK